MTPLKREFFRFAAVLCLGLAATACEKSLSDRTSKAPGADSPNPSSVVSGHLPAESKGDTQTAQTAPVDGGVNGTSKPVENQAMPVPGQANDHSNLSTTPSQKAETPAALQSVDGAKKANASDASGSPPR